MKNQTTTTSSVDIRTTFKTPTLHGKRRVLLVVGVLSKLSAISWRVAIRETWMNVCKENVDKVVCKFFTDEIDFLPKKNQTLYLEEKEKNDDLVYMPFQG